MFNDPSGLVGENARSNDDSGAGLGNDPVRERKAAAARDREAHRNEASARHYAGGGGGGQPSIRHLAGAAQRSWPFRHQMGGGGVWFQNLGETERPMNDVNAMFKAVYGLKRDVVRISKTFLRNNPDNRQKYHYRLVTKNAFDWNTDQYTSAIWDLINQDKAIYGDLYDMGAAKDAMGLDASVPNFRALHRNYFIVETTMPMYQRGGEISLAMVFVHELIFHKHATFSYWLQSQ